MPGNTRTRESAVPACTAATHWYMSGQLRVSPLTFTLEELFDAGTVVDVVVVVEVEVDEEVDDVLEAVVAG